ncbi:HAD family hydrolase [Amycolatopsis sp. MtRt-6]|uniref:HAD-IA family hydrolase n=1 Tax=Amycolatopsis sp. MtRt-6 TaxID=2792782 RepID=UPI001A8E8088
MFAARRLGPAPDRCVAVEDSASGIRSAHAAGMTVLAVPNPATARDQAVLELAHHQASGARIAAKTLATLLGSELNDLESQSGAGSRGPVATTRHSCPCHNREHTPVRPWWVTAGLPGRAGRPRPVN